MKTVSICTLAAFLAFTASAQAAPISAISQISYSTMFRINTGADAPAGLDMANALTFPTPLSTSSLSSPDAINQVGSTAHIAGSTPADPSVYTFFDRTTRNGGTEGAEANQSLSVYGVGALDADPSNGAAIVHHGMSGSATEQAQITTAPYDTGASDNMLHQRDFTIRNVGPSDLLFTMTVEMDLLLATQTIGAGGYADSFLEQGLSFASDDPLEISVLPLEPYSPSETTVGANSMTTLERSASPVGDGLIGLSASASSVGIGPGIESAGVTASQSFLLGIGLARDQVLTLSHFVTYGGTAVIFPAVSQVHVPAGLPLLMTGILGLGMLRLHARRKTHTSLRRTQYIWFRV